MNVPIPVTAKPGWAPTGSTYGSLAGGALATFVLAIFASYGHDLGTTAGAALTTFLSTVVGYYFPGGRS